MLRPRGPCGLEDKSFVLGFSLTLSGLGLMVIGLVDKQQQLERMCMELEAANSKGNSRKLFQIVKSMTRN